MQDLAFAREHVVLHVQPQHRRQVAAHDGRCDNLRETRRVPAPLFDGMQRLQPRLDPLRVLLEVSRHARIQIPAVVIEADCRIGDESLHILRRFLFELQKTNHHISNLHAGVVDVVLHLYLGAARAQQAHKGVPQRGVAQVADMGSLVRVNVGVLDDDLAALPLRGSFRRGFQWLRVACAVQEQVDVTRPGDLDASDTRQRAQRTCNFLGDLPRRSSQLSRQLHRQRQGHVAHLRPRRHIHDNVCLKAVLPLDKLSRRLLDLGL